MNTLAPEGQPGRMPGGKPSVMVVDDDALIVDVLMQSLFEEGISCCGFQNAEEAIAYLKQQPVDSLVVDIVMPGMGGFELIARAKQLHPGVTAIVMTGFVDKFSYDEAMRAGAADFIKKPFTTQELLVRLKHAQMQDHLRELSITDELTGLANRRGFFAFAVHQLKQARRTGERLVLLYADLDNLKTINDTGGHEAGDRALVDAARIFRDTFRDSDIIARMGGDEFAVLLVNSPESAFAAVKTRLENRLEAHNARCDGKATLSVSLGMSIFNPAAKTATIDDLIREADEHMYRNKHRKKTSQQPADAS
ncbi:MAG: diguanylate cyclase [Nitrospiraceae bacterium]|nr:diguanylate cyclase [Nitrospiraceae bacterium]